MLDNLQPNEETGITRFLTIARIALPAMMTFLFQSLSECINTYFIGRHLNDAHILAGAGMGNIIISMICVAVYQGMNGALETLISQAIGASSGSQSKLLAIVYLNRGRIIIFLTFIPIVVALLNIDKVLIALGQDPLTSKYSHEYIVWQIPGLVIQSQFDCTMRYLSAYQKSHIPMITQGVCTALHVLWCRLLIVHCEMGVIGASIAICITYTSNYLALIVYTTCFEKSERKIWSFTSQSLLGLPGALILMLDMWCYEIINLAAGYLIIEATAAQIILNNIQIICNQVPLGVSIAASTIIGGAIGENNVKKARSYIFQILLFSASISLTLQLTFHLGKENIVGLFTTDENVERYVFKAMNWASLCILIDSLVTVSIGIIKGIGKQASATVAYLICFYVISVPASFYFCFSRYLGLRGLWIGLSIGLVVLILSLLLIIRKADWLKIGHQAKQKFLRETLIFKFSTVDGIECSSELSSSISECKHPFDELA